MKILEHVKKHSKKNMKKMPRFILKRIALHVNISFIFVFFTCVCVTTSCGCIKQYWRNTITVFCTCHICPHIFDAVSYYYYKIYRISSIRTPHIFVVNILLRLFYINFIIFFYRGRL